MALPQASDNDVRSIDLPPAPEQHHFRRENLGLLPSPPAGRRAAATIIRSSLGPR